jgi:hypothetical protein
MRQVAHVTQHAAILGHGFFRRLVRLVEDMRADIGEYFGENVARDLFRVVECRGRVRGRGTAVARDGFLPRIFTACRGAEVLEQAHDYQTQSTE